MPLDIVLVVALAIVIVSCLAAIGLLLHERNQSTLLRTHIAETEQARDNASATARKLESQLGELQPRLNEAAVNDALVKQQAERINQLEADFKEAQETRSSTRAENAALREHVKAVEQRETDVRKLLEGAQNSLTTEFRNVATAILEVKSKSLDEENRKTLATVLGPFSVRLAEFKTAVEETHKTDIRERSSLKTEIAQLTGLNKTLGAQAQSLTDALRGQSKVRGNWGEAVLARVLEESGLREGHEFMTQPSFTTEDNRRQQPDVVVNLPDDRFVIIDSKLSLVAYEQYVAANDEATRAAALREHIAALQTHVNELARKDYCKLYELKTLDFVLMFVPIEPALMLALQSSPELSENALAKHVALVSPNTLYTSLRTIEYLWRIDRTSKNMRQIVKLGGLLYDSAVLFAESLEEVGVHLNKAQTSWTLARKRLTDGGQSLLSRASRLRQLGVSSQKHLPTDLQDAVDADTPESGQLSTTITGALLADGSAVSTDEDNAPP